MWIKDVMSYYSSRHLIGQLERRHVILECDMGTTDKNNLRSMGAN